MPGRYPLPLYSACVKELSGECSCRTGAARVPPSTSEELVAPLAKPEGVAELQDQVQPDLLEAPDAFEELAGRHGRSGSEATHLAELSGLLERRARLYDQPSEELGSISVARTRTVRADKIHPMKAARLEREERRRAGMARRSGDNHYKRRLKRRREKYHRVERKFKLKRDITQDEFVALMYTMIDSRYIYEYIFSIYRVDTSKPISTSNITIVDRYSNIVLYSSI